MAAEKGAWEREECRKNVVVVDDADEGGDDENNFDYNWGRAHHGRCHGTHRGQRHEAKGGPVNGRSWVARGIDMGKVVRLRSRSDACEVEAGDSMKVPDEGKAIVGQATYRLAQFVYTKSVNTNQLRRDGFSILQRLIKQICAGNTDNF
jgi:hypothetical protein